jgi:hypothetical protein
MPQSSIAMHASQFGRFLQEPLNRFVVHSKPRPTPPTRWALKLPALQPHNHKAPDTISNVLDQVSDLSDHLDSQAALARTSELLTDIQQQYRRLNQRQQRVEAVLALLGDPLRKS